MAFAQIRELHLGRGLVAVQGFLLASPIVVHEAKSVIRVTDLLRLSSWINESILQDNTVKRLLKS